MCIRDSVWNSKSDVDMLDLFEVQFRITPSDNDVGEFGVTGLFHVDNNDIPSITLVTPEGEQVADVVIAYQISDREGDLITLKPEFSRDAGATWEPATVTGQLEDIGPANYSGSLVWNSKSDTDMLDLFEVQFRITPFDNDEGELGVTGLFHVDNNDPPKVVSLGPVDDVVTADVIIPYTLYDREGDALDILCEYSTDGGATWHPATVKNPTENLTGDKYSGNIIWDSLTDLFGVDKPDCAFRVTPFDNDEGEAAIVR